VTPHSSMNTYTDITGTYHVDPIIEWVNQNRNQCIQLNTRDFLPYVQLDTWGNSLEEPLSNLQRFMTDEEKRKKVLAADLSHPIVVTNDNRIIDGIHRLFKALYQGHEKISSVFIENTLLQKFRIPEQNNGKKEIPTTGLSLPIPDRYIRVPKSALPLDKDKRRALIEDYFSDHLPSVEEEEEGWLICLERPQERYGSYTHDKAMSHGLEWWKKGSTISDIPFDKKLFANGLLAIEDQWMPYSWSRYFHRIGKIPSEVILLHLDDHQDMMSPRIGKRLDGKLFDYITGDSLSLDDPKSVEAAILSGAIGKGSILLPLLWSVEKVHVRHLCYRPHAYDFYNIKRTLTADPLLSKSNNRISLQLEPTHREKETPFSTYAVTPNVEEWLKDLPNDVPILFHIDMDYFNDRFDGSSNWEEENKRIHDVSLESQLKQIELVFSYLKKRNIVPHIVDTSIGISPSFYPAEFWSTTVPGVLNACEKIGIKLNE
jgi:hypothetical protein